MSDIGLGALFPEIGTETFLEDYWPARSRASHGDLARLEGLAALRVLEDPARLARMFPGRAKGILADARGHREVGIERGQMAALYESGFTIAANNLQTSFGAAARWVACLEAELGVAHGLGHCNLYLSPPSGGLSHHFDDHEVLIVQLAGSKRWRLAANDSVRFPARNYVPRAGPPGELDLYRRSAFPEAMPSPDLVVDLQPGSVLFVPRGHWHETEAGRASLSLTFGFGAPPWHRLVADAMRLHLASLEEWREPAWGAWADGEARAAAERRLRELLRRLPDEIASLSAKTLLESYPYEHAVLRRTGASPNLQRRFSRAPGVNAVHSTASGDLRLTVETDEERCEVELPVDAEGAVAWVSRRRSSFTLGELASVVRSTCDPEIDAPAFAEQLAELCVSADLLREVL